MHPAAANPNLATPTGRVVTDPTTGTLEALYRERYPASVRLAHLLVGDRARAEELAQDAFVRIAPRVGSLDDAAAYLRATLVNLCRDDGRRTVRARSQPRERERTAAPPAIPATSTAVWLALRELPERQRIALCLRYYDDLPDDAIAEVLGVRPATVRSLVHRGLAALKEVVPRD